MRNFLKSNLISLFITVLLVSILWGVIRIELILLIPLFYQVDFLFDILVYGYSGYQFGKVIARYHYKKTWLIVILPLLFYLGDRLLSPRIILGTPYSGRTETAWRIIIELLIIILCITFAWKGRIDQNREIEPTMPRHC
jgi:hypothetical protein